MGNGFEMRSLEHCLNDIMKGVNDGGPPDYNKGESQLQHIFRGIGLIHFFKNCVTFVCLWSLGKPYFSRIEDHISEETNAFDGLTIPSMGSPARSSPHSQGSEVNERFSRKVFVGGLPPDIDEGMLPSKFSPIKEKNQLHRFVPTDVGAEHLHKCFIRIFIFCLLFL